MGKDPGVTTICTVKVTGSSKPRTLSPNELGRCRDGQEMQGYMPEEALPHARWGENHRTPKEFTRVHGCSAEALQQSTVTGGGRPSQDGDARKPHGGLNG